MTVKAFVVALFGLIVLALAVGSALIKIEAGKGQELGAALWPGHPRVLRETALREIGEAAAQSQLPSAGTMRSIRKLANRAPLEPDAFLVEAALAEKRGELARAERLLIEARKLDPRSPAARVLLSTLYIKAGAVLPGLREMEVLARFFPRGVDQVVPVLAAYAAAPGGMPTLRQLLAERPDLEPKLLLALAGNADNANLILKLASGRPGPNVQAPAWQGVLLTNLVQDGQYAAAYRIWAKLVGAGSTSGGLYRPDFAVTAAPPPFNWTLAKFGGGIAEPVAGGVHVLHYGRSRIVLAGQMIVLPAGRFQLSMNVSGNVGGDGQLRWQIRCLPAGKPLLDLPLTRSNARPTGQFATPPGGCGAYQVELVGLPQDAPMSSDATISALRLARVSG